MADADFAARVRVDVKAGVGLRVKLVFRFEHFDDVFRAVGFILRFDVDLPVAERYADVRAARNRRAVADDDRAVWAHGKYRAVNHSHMGAPVRLRLNRIARRHVSFARNQNRLSGRSADNPHVAFKGNYLRRVLRNVRFFGIRLKRTVFQPPPAARD